jgi:hypothetical protein
MAHNLDVSLDPDRNPPVDCTEDNLTFGTKSKYTFGVSEGAEVDWDDFQYYDFSQGAGECRGTWAYEATMENGDPLPSFIRFYTDERTSLFMMPHAKSEVGSYSVNLTATDTTDGFEPWVITETFEIKVEENLYTALKETEEAVEVRIGDSISFSFGPILNEADLDYKLTLEEGPEWGSYSTS